MLANAVHVSGCVPDIICVAQITWKFIDRAQIVYNGGLLLLRGENLADLLRMKERLYLDSNFCQTSTISQSESATRWQFDVFQTYHPFLHFHVLDKAIMENYPSSVIFRVLEIEWTDQRAQFGRAALSSKPIYNFLDELLLFGQMCWRKYKTEMSFVKLNYRILQKRLQNAVSLMYEPHNAKPASCFSLTVNRWKTFS